MFCERLVEMTARRRERHGSAWRWNNLIFSSSSKGLQRRLTVDFGKLSKSAASIKLPVSAIRWNNAKSLVFVVDLFNLDMGLIIKVSRLLQLL